VHKLQKHPLAIPDTKTYQDLEIWRCSGARQIGKKEWVDLSKRKKREAKKKMEESRTPNFVTWRPKKSCDLFKRDFLGKRALIRHISRKTKLNSPYLFYSRFLYGASRLRGLENYLLFSLTSSQIWLNPSFG
jgi:hypothetical protein